MTEEQEKEFIERRVETQAHVDERIFTLLKDHMPERRPTWQIISFLLLATFYTGASWYQINQNTTQLKAVVDLATDNKAAMVFHLKWELEREVASRDDEIQRLRRKLQENQGE